VRCAPAAPKISNAWSAGSLSAQRQNARLRAQPRRPGPAEERAFSALRQAGLDFYSIASPASFRSEPELAWGFYGHRLALYRRTVPHAGFALLKSWGERRLQGYTAFTSNVDGQFQKAGLAAESVHECHGSIHHLQCLQPCCAHIWPADDFHPEVDEA
jgi:NAD-dependent SIR2 family protein deacetylase